MDWTTILGFATGGVTLLGAAWRATRGLHRFIDAVARNTGAVEQLAHDLRDHTTATTTALTALDKRVTVLETSS
ncbi:hypothetical protein [Streptomyces sp. NPDC056144]|uniref:hypothetical protein n=1 Tax=unclassified Streptomyces TaxID=2593676 RepID=UPI0035DDC3D9